MSGDAQQPAPRFELRGNPGETTIFLPYMTQRTYIATAALQALLPEAVSLSQAARDAVVTADSLIAELNRKEGAE